MLLPCPSSIKQVLGAQTTVFQSSRLSIFRPLRLNLYLIPHSTISSYHTTNPKMPLRNAPLKEYYAKAGPSGYNTHKPLPLKPKRKTFAEQARNDPQLQDLGWLLDDNSYNPSISSKASSRYDAHPYSRATATELRSWLDPPSPTHFPTSNPPPRHNSRNWRAHQPTYPRKAKVANSRNKPLPAAPDKPLPPAPWDTDYAYTRPYASGPSRPLRHKQKVERFELRPKQQPRLVPYASQRAYAPGGKGKVKLEPLRQGFVKGEVIETRGDRLRVAGGKRPKTTLKSEWEAERRRRQDLERARARERRGGGGRRCCAVM